MDIEKIAQSLRKALDFNDWYAFHSLEKPPSLGSQLEDLRSFVGELCRENDDMYKLPIGPPRCENLKRVAKFEYWETSEAPKVTRPVGIHRFYQNDPLNREIDHSRECPHCGGINYAHKSTPIGSVVNCGCCGGTFQW